ncbi:hypothetical protein M231_05139 [Tremella mesenterica]|uniref:DH domain-containing protein n=1 Tax=Tremella mesenterica TaxID=5217 RepID=A0A4V1M3P6_TREME|nr:hypothetical protein M231_05139 [Tremella mesenterica]
MTSYEATAGPSRHYTPPLPPPVPSKSPSPTRDDATWTDGNGTTPMPRSMSESTNIDEKADNAKRNPLIDLLDTEKVYVEHLGLVIRRVAAAWSRKDFPPPKLDVMFRCVESVYRANRAFGTKLKEIGPNPASPKAIGDLLMRWIDDLEIPYRKYTSTYLMGFDTYPAVMKNTLLPNILVEISSSNPPPQPLSRWTLDALFLLPFTRLRYYRKLYARLLRATKEGRSDHRLLLVATERLDSLISQIESRLELDVSEDTTPDPAISPPPPPIARPADNTQQEKERQSRTSSALDSSFDSQTNSRLDPRSSNASSATSVTHSPQRKPQLVPLTTTSGPPSATAPITDLELRIDTERALDLFTMQRKKCKLQMNPVSLPFTRYLRSSFDVSIYFTPTSTGQQVVHSRAHVYILSDLFLVAEWMDVADKAAKAQQVAQEQPERVGQGGPMPELWLVYPPLAGKHLVVSEGSQANVLNVTIMRKETFVIHTESDVVRDRILKDLAECIEFAASMSRRNTSQPSPADARSPSSLSDHRSAEGQFPPFRYPSPFSVGSSPATSPRPSELQDPSPPMPLGGSMLATQMQNFSLQPGETVPWGRGPSPPPPTQTSSQSGGNSLPPRGASLRQRIPSIGSSNGHSSGVNQLGMSSNINQHPSIPYPNSSEPILPGQILPRSLSGRSTTSGPRPPEPEVYLPIPQIRGAGSHLSDPHSFPLHNPPSRSRSAEPLRPPEPPSARFSSFPSRGASPAQEPDSPPMSPVEEEAPTLTGPAVISAQMKCKVFLKQAHQQWKSLGAARLKLYVQKERNVKQLVVEADSSSKTMLISTIVLTDGVERVAKTGVAVEISDRGQRTGIVYMIQLRNENSAHGLFESLLAGSDRRVGR